MDYKVTDTELTAVANAIRTKGGTSALLEWPDEYISAVNNISGGGIPSGDELPSTAEIYSLFKLLVDNWWELYIYNRDWVKLYSTQPLVTIRQVYNCTLVGAEVGDSVSSVTLANVDSLGGIVVTPSSRNKNIYVVSDNRYIVQVGTCSSTATLPTIISYGSGRQSYSHNIDLAGGYTASITGNTYDIFMGNTDSDSVDIVTIVFSQV